MEPADHLAGVQRTVLAVALVANGALFWRGAVDIFSVARATLVVGATVILAALSAVRLARTGRVVVPRSPVVTLTALFAAALVLSVTAGGDPMRSVIGPYTRYTGVASYVAYAALLVLVVRLHSGDSVHHVAWAVVAGLAVVAVYGVVQYAGLDPFDWPQSEAEARLFGRFDTRFSTLGNIDFSAAFVGIAAPLAAWGALDGGHRVAVRAGSAAVFAAAAVYGLGSDAFQGPVTLVAGSGVVVAVWSWDRRSRWRRLRPGARQALAVGAAAVAAGVLLAAPMVGSRAVDEFAQADERVQFWRTAVDVWVDHPVTGAGLATFTREFTARRPAAHAAEQGFKSADAPHNVPLELLAGGGILVAGPYVALVAATGIVLVRGLRRSDGERRLLLAGFGGSWLAYQLQSMVSLDVPPLALLHWTVTGAIWVLAATPLLASRELFRPAAGRLRPAAEVAVAGLTVVALWLTSQPLRADLAAGRARDARLADHLEESAEQAERATALAPWEGSYWAFRAGALDRLGDVDGAYQAGVRAAHEAPWNSGYALAVAGLAERRGGIGDAFAWLEEARRRDPKNVAVLQVTARFNLRAGSATVARDVLLQAAAVNPEDPTTWRLLGQAYDALGRAREARQAYERALALEPGDARRR